MNNSSSRRNQHPKKSTKERIVQVISWVRRLTNPFRDINIQNLLIFRLERNPLKRESIGDEF